MMTMLEAAHLEAVEEQSQYTLRCYQPSLYGIQGQCVDEMIHTNGGTQFHRHISRLARSSL